jgi:arsenate reductase (thioredoxin)
MIGVRHDHSTKIRNRKRLTKSITRILTSCGIMMTLLPAFVWGQRKVSPAPSPTVVFICEHGAARSVIAAAYFNKLASERHLNFHAIARGIAAQPGLSASAVTGLQRDNVPFPREKPRNATRQEVQRAVRVVAFCRVPDSLSGTKRLETFDVPAPDAGYEASRDAITSHVKALIDELALQSVAPRATRTQ